ncbi:MAG TPA: Gfo/Idh/MocA family oxidoreductase [Candidatus Angelobacter sp.]|nr:Gfo/Idh/MocA family oxidoreductase [Candidatus Angelobacter sp.]
MTSSINRRQFLKHSAGATAGALLAGVHTQARRISPNEKLNIGMIGVANRAGDDLKEVSGENIVALCDIDDNYLAAVKQKFPQAKTYNDFRRLLDQQDIDAVVVGTPDHTHAVAAVAALRSGRQVYCEKPLARTISETRVITETARKLNRVTQIGTQIHAGSNYRRVVELVQSGAVGPVREVHVWVAATYGGMELPKETVAVPANIHYDLWLGPVEYRPYSPEYVPFKWRNWWAFGGGALADFGCHFMDLPHWALSLSHPATIDPVDGPPVHPESTPPWLIVRYEYPARGDKPPVRLTWYHGGKQPSLLSTELAAKWKSGVLFVGEKGQLLADYGRHALLPEKDFADFKPPAPFIKDSIGHHKEWIEACKTGGQTTCRFDYSGPLTEAALLGNVAYRVGRKLDWDWKQMKATNCAEAGQYIQHHYRKGWRI